MGWMQCYKQKTVSFDEAVKSIKSGDRVLFSPCLLPIDLLNAMVRRYKELKDVSAFGLLVLNHVEFFKAEYKGHINAHTLFMGPFERKMYNEGNLEVTSYQFGQTAWMTEHRIKADVFMLEVSPPDENGNMSFGALGNFNGHIAAKLAKTVIVQVNKEMPYVYGPSEAFVNVKDVTYICEKDHPLFELPQPEVSDVDKTIASHILPYIEDGSTIQIGIGGLSNAIGYSLEHHKNLGVHTEMFTDSMVSLMEKGVINGSAKTLNPGEVTISFGLGSRNLYQYMHRNEKLAAYPIDYITNESVIAKNNKFVSINNALMSDLTGQICSESMGFDQFSATGGQLNFVRGAAIAPGGKSFLAFKSVAQKKDGKLVSRITTALPPGAVVTTPRTDAQYVATEYGVADIRGKSIEQRVKSLISIAHPDFRDQLYKEAKENRLII